MTGPNDQTYIADGHDQELFSLDEHKKLAKMGYIDLDAEK